MKDIQEQIINYNKSVRYTAPWFIVVHDTGDPGASAQNEHDYFSGGDRQASADFFVDDDNIIQIIDTDSYYSWHCGDGRGAYGIKNSNSLGIEMCLKSDGTVSDETEQSTIELVLHLMDKYSIPIERVVRHYDASRKCCPGAFSSNNWARWWNFKDKLASGNASNGKWMLEDNKWWYLRSDNTYPRDCWEKINEKWYLFDISGYMQTGWKSDEGKWYYLGDSNDGAMKTGWVYDKNANKWYYCNSYGTMQTGWVKDNDKWYYLDTSGAMQTGWVKDGEKDYCLYSDGSMIHDCDLYGYRFASDGAAIKIE
ncbi:peptidoglycan recognition protein family protein [Clostridium beijerinckii]|uniref:peptidoglycan recognition protein family protein n=1 Tax=Clostridium beijerinckii TaxID=1520 RepID=UPI001FAD4894|nr:N-acetylmuramoyl-L-alanine amidase [Clostridium beijerinckii]